MQRWSWRHALLTPLIPVLLLAAACGDDDSSAAGASTGGEINLVAYSTPQAAYQAIESAFQATEAGKDVTFSESYGGSGDQSRAVEAGQAADYVAFSLEPDINRLVKADLVAADWNTDQYHGMVTDSVVVFVVRKGNPKNIKTWDDLLGDGVEVITPNPFTSGGARWNIMAAYGAQLAQGKSEDEAVQYLTDLFGHVPVQDDSARKALETFTTGKGDVMLAYENEAIFAQQQPDVDIDYVVPDQTILIENPAAITKNASNSEAAQAFLDFVHSEEAQQIFADNGYRPVVDGVADGDFPTPADLFDISEFGGWTDVTAKFFDPDGSIMATIEQGIGVSTG